MNTAPSIRSRFAFTAVFSAGRMALSFLTGILIARTLGPERYGNYMFLMGSFLGVRQLLDLGTSTAFYTFLCQRTRGAKFIFSYLGWQALQFLVAVLLIGLIFPDQVINFLWVKQDRGQVLLAFFSIFLSQQVGLTITQIGESLRKTHRVQILNFLTALVFCVGVFIASRLGTLSVSVAFTISITVSALSFLVAFRFIPIALVPESEVWQPKVLLREYVQYCSPLALYTAISFVYTFADYWLLQHYGGARQQGFYSVANQFSVAGLFATNAMLNIFWKETADLFQSGQRERLISIYHRTSRFLFFCGVAICGILSPWAKEIAVLSLGPTYAEGALILAVMFIYPAHQCINQLNSTLFFATGKTKEYVLYGSIFMLASVVVSFFIQAPPEATIPGLGLGAMGMAMKMVVLNIAGAVFTSVWLAKIFGFRYDWRQQVVSVTLCFTLGALSAHFFRLMFYAGTEPNRIQTLIMLGLSGLVYAGALALVVWKFPRLVGFRDDELKQMLSQLTGGRFV